MSKPSLWISPGARYAVVFLFFLSVVLSAGSYYLAVSADQRQLVSRASVVQLCQAGNEARAQQVTLWTHLIAISTPPPRQTQAERKQRQALITSFLRYVHQVFAPQPCSAKFR